MNRSLIRTLAEHVLRGRSNLRVAEMAAGSGFGAHLLAQRAEVALSIAADLNLEDFHQAKIPNYRAAFLRTDIFKAAVQRGSLDLVWNSSSVEELPDPAAAVIAMAALAKPGGRVFVGVPNRHGAAAVLGRLSSARGWVGKAYSRAELRQLLLDARLRIEHETTYLYGTFIGALGRKPF
jgi:SAM-dependent methyltransferase